MASVSGVSSSNMNALYGSRNVMSGLASGLDTESMIENSISGYRLKISGLQQKQTKLEWKQTAYRDLTDQMVQFSQKYTSYSSSTNLLSASFFDRSVLTTANGANAAKVSASGKTSSTVAINGVAQLAAASRYEVARGQGILSSVETSGGQRFITAGSAVDLAGQVSTSSVSGSISLTYGSQELSISLGDTVYQDVTSLKDAIAESLKGQYVSYTGGTMVSADQAIQVEVLDGKITFTDKKSNNDVYISGLSGAIGQTFGTTTYDSNTKNNSLDFSGVSLTNETSRSDLIAGKDLSFTLDGVTKTIKMPSATELAALTPQELIDNYLQPQLTGAFGTQNGTPRITVGNASTDSSKLQLSFTVGKSSALTVTSGSNYALGLDATASSYLNTSKTLGDLLQGNASINWDAGQALTINGVAIGTYSKDTALETVLRDINANVEAGVSVSYSRMSNQFVFNSKETGAAAGIKTGGIGSDSLGAALFGTFQESQLTAGKDAIVNLDVNGANLTVTRSSNTFDVDGLSVSVNGTFNGTMTGENAAFDFLDASGTIDRSKLSNPVTFTTKADSDKIVEAVKSMVQDYNKMLTELRGAFRTVPAQKSNGSKYEPLTESDMESMSDTAIKNYEEKAKQGLLFGDQDLSAMYDQLVRALTPGGADGVALRNMGIGTGYSQGLTTIEFDETKFREALSNDPNGVRDAFTKVAGNGSSTNGIMLNLQNTLKTYASVEGTKGILINKAGSKYSATSLLKNALKDDIDAYETQVTNWQDKMSTKIDYYTRQFTRLEKLINEMNSQSSSLTNLMGS